MTASLARFALVLIGLGSSIPALAQQPQPQPAKPSPEVATLTETVGLLAGLQLYQTYLNIGLLADARAEGLYESSELAQLLGSVTIPLEKVDQQLQKVAALKLSKEDVAAVARMRKLAGLLRQQGAALQTFWDRGGEEHGKKYETARQAAWKELEAVLELNPAKEVAPPPRK